MKNEADYKLALVKEIKALGGKARRLEDKYALGLLDLVIKLPGHPVIWAEGKLVQGHKFGPTERQYIEGMEWAKAGATALLLGWKDSTMYISPWVKQADRRECRESSGVSNYVKDLIMYLNGQLSNAEKS
jgi:hypothetical protein